MHGLQFIILSGSLSSTVLFIARINLNRRRAHSEYNKVHVIKWRGWKLGVRWRCPARSLTPIPPRMGFRIKWLGFSTRGRRAADRWKGLQAEYLVENYLRGGVVDTHVWRNACLHKRPSSGSAAPRFLICPETATGINHRSDPRPFLQDATSRALFSCWLIRICEFNGCPVIPADVTSIFYLFFSIFIRSYYIVIF